MTSAARASRVAERALLVAGLGVFVAFWYELGASAVVTNLRLVGWGIAPIVLQEFFAYLANTLGWLAAFPRPRPRVLLPRLFAARVAGDAVNYVTPSATLAGEFVRTRFLRGWATDTSIVASVAVAKLSQTVGQIAFIVVGLAAVMDDTPLPSGVRLGVLGAVAILSALAGALLFGQRRGMLAPLLRLVQRWGLRGRAPELGPHLQRLDAEIARFHDGARGAFVLSSAGFFVGWALGAVEISLILWFLGVPVTVHRAVAIEVLSVAMDGVLFFVPAKVGTQEGGKVLIFTVLGLGPGKGLALGILRRIRELTWALIGLLILSRQHLGPRRALDRDAERAPVSIER